MSASRTGGGAGLRTLLEPVVAAAGCDIEDVTVTPAGRRRLVRVVVDRDGGLSLDDVAELSPAVSAALDAADALGETPYVLEVTSPGVDRPLRTPRQWQRARGRLVRVAVAGAGTVTGRIESADADGVVLQVLPPGGNPAAAGDGLRRYPYAELGAGAVQVEFDRADGADGG